MPKIEILDPQKPNIVIIIMIKAAEQQLWFNIEIEMLRNIFGVDIFEVLPFTTKFLNLIQDHDKVVHRVEETRSEKVENGL